MPERLFYMYFPAEAPALLAPQRPPAPLFFPQAQYFTMKVSFTPADLAAAQAAMACHSTQFNPEQLKVLQPGFAKLWNGAIAFVPALAKFSGSDLFK